ALVAAEVSVAFVLLTGAGLLLKSLSKLNNFNPGFDPSGMLVAHTVLLGNRYADNTAARLAAAREITFRLEGLPGVAAVTFGNSLPLTSDMDASGSAIEGRTFAAHEYPFVRIRGVAANYFQTLHVPLLEGRHLAPSDNETGEKVAVINATMARRYWPEESAVGKRVRPDALQTKDWLEIVGVVADIKNESLTQRPRPEIYFSYAQFPSRGLSLMLRTTLPPLALAESLRREIGKVDSTLAVTDVQTMEQAKAESFNATGFQSLLLGGFAGLALLLAATGIYGVLSYSVGQRSREIGIRMALGARMDNVRSLVLRGGMKAVLLGIGLGLVAAVILTRFMARLLFQVDAIDPATFAAAAVMLIGTAVLACYIPAQRATRVDPMEALRSE
ncbi:MAG TPA: ABC transporter permease, partial [Candidatus Dormibacteraeota bacterium]|nr:ABC transporter permease [Candidatus Dormibacteraeota bacterium]